MENRNKNLIGTKRFVNPKRILNILLKHKMTKIVLIINIRLLCTRDENKLVGYHLSEKE